jgi:hypothetical protein
MIKLMGWIDSVYGHIYGWAVDLSDPRIPVKLDLFVDGSFYRSVIADQHRPDLQILGLGTDLLGFSCDAPPFRNYRLPMVFGRADEQFIIPTESAYQYKSFGAFLSHPRIFDSVNSTLSVEYRSPVATPPVLFLRRLVESFNAATQISDDDYGPIWNPTIDLHRDVIDLIMENKTEELGSYLAHFAETKLVWGFFGGPLEHSGIRDNAVKNLEAIYAFDRILSIAEFLGIINVENPEQGSWGEVFQLEINQLLSRIADHLGIDLSPPEIGGYWGLNTNFGYFNWRILDSLFSAIRITQVLQALGGSTIVEIGGGTGIVAHYAIRLGASSYKIVDLPTVSLVQAFTLRDVEGLTLFGEGAGSDVIKLVPPRDFRENTAGKYDILLNVDSFPEIETQSAVEYLRTAPSHGIRLFLSINQEARAKIGDWPQNTVPSLLNKAGKWQRLSRNRYWMRPGYVEELYRYLDPVAPLQGEPLRKAYFEGYCAVRGVACSS